jgi:two-component sensor histidine kinase
LKPEAAQSLGLALHELTANAATHGALSRAGGRIDVNWQPAPKDGGFELVWRETGGPEVVQPQRRGFGRMVIEHNLTRALDAQVSLEFAPGGLSFRVSVPQNQLAAKTSQGTSHGWAR